MDAATVLVLVTVAGALLGCGLLLRAAIAMRHEADMILLHADERLREAQYVANRSARWHG